MRTLRVILPILAICLTLFSACKKEKVTGITLNKHELSLAPGDTEQLIATIEPKDADNKEVRWISATPAIATVDENGLVTAIELGWTYIDVVTQDGKHKDFCSVRVDYKQHVTGVTLNKTELSLSPGDTEQLIAAIEPEDADNKELRWESSNPEVVTVDTHGLVTAIKNGDATITVTTKDGNKTAFCSILVIDYRDKWVGSYECEKDKDKRVIVDVTAKGDSILYIVERDLEEYKNGVNQDVIVKSDGSFLYNDSRPFVFGNFYLDSLSMSYVYPSPGQTVHINYYGKKINKE